MERSTNERSVTMSVKLLRSIDELQRNKGKNKYNGQYGGLILLLVIGIELEEHTTNRTRDLGVSSESLLAPRSNQLTVKDVR
jgi:hypothetical protein